jgi:alkyl sulfatase BDS1-like metallo-beta-lactamase superfamily hydrolase
MMGGADGVMRGARSAFDEGDYRWVVEVLKHLIFSDPQHREARSLSADAMEQLGYQSESATWRNAYLMGAHELRNGSIQLAFGRPSPVSVGMTGEQLIDMMGTRFNPSKCTLDTLSVSFTITDLDDENEPLTHRLTVENQTIHHDTDPETVLEADVAVTLGRASMIAAITAPDQLDAQIADGSIAVGQGDVAALHALLGALDVFGPANLIEP